MLNFLKTNKTNKPIDHPRMIGKPGAHGFAYWPALLCASDTVDKNNYVSKIFYENPVDAKKSFESELRELKIIEEIDPEHKFSLSMISACKQPTASLDRSIVNLHPVLRNVLKQEYVNVINIEYGGIDLHTLLEVHSFSICFETFICSLRPLLEGLHKLNDVKNTVHRDLKPSNILMDNRKHPIRFSIIDFGLTCPQDTVFTYESKNVLSHKYAIFPPEFQILGYILYIIKNQQPHNLDALIKMMHENMDMFLEKANFNIKSNYYHYDYLPKIVDANSTFNMKDSDIKDFMNHIYESLADLQNALEPYDAIQKYVAENNIAAKCDIYSLGYVLLLYSQKPRKITYKESGQDKFFFNTITQMLAFNPLKRMNAQNVLEQLEIYNICPLPHKCGSPESKWKVATPRKTATLDNPFNVVVSRTSLDRTRKQSPGGGLEVSANPFATLESEDTERIGEI